MSLTSVLMPKETGENPVDALIQQLESVLLGKEEQVKLAVCCLLAKGHLLVEDRPGVGKTTLAHAIGQSLGLQWKRVQFTNDLLPADICGVSVFNQAQAAFEFKPGPVFAPLLMADEINRAPPRSQSALLEAMEERQVTVDGNTYQLDPLFFVVATQNPADRAGAYPLPESQLDRFLAGTALGYPEAEIEKELLLGNGSRSNKHDLEPVCNAEQLSAWQQSVTQVHVAPAVVDYTHALLQATRDREIRQQDCRGMSPRAGINLINMARAHAYLKQRAMVLPEDIQAVFPSVAGHRLTGSVTSGAELSQQILDAVPLN